MADMRSIAVALETYATDTNLYPEVAFEELEQFLVPTYIRELPKVDAWGTPFWYAGNSDRSSYRIVSAGADRQFEHNSRHIGPADEGPFYGDSSDIIFQDGTFTRFPPELQREQP